MVGSRSDEVGGAGSDQVVHLVTQGFNAAESADTVNSIRVKSDCIGEESKVNLPVRSLTGCVHYTDHDAAAFPCCLYKGQDDNKRE